MIRTFVIALISVLLIILLLFPSKAQMNESKSTVSVSGEGIVKVEPDMVIVRFGVVTRDNDPVKARQLNEDASAKALEAVRNLGVAERKMKVTVLQLNEIREYDRERRRQIPAGFEAIRQVVVELDELDKLAQLIAGVTQQGANRLFGISYDISNRSGVRNEALKKAAADAREKATVLSSELNVTLGKVLAVNEQSFHFPGPIPVRAMMADQREAAMDMGTPEAYAAGEIEVRAQVQVEFLIE
jgi:uncharacterized protein